MIMAGRGRRLTGETQEPIKSAGPSLPAESLSNMSSFVTMINEINITGMNAPLFAKIQGAVNEMFTTKEDMRNALSDLHNKAICDPLFGEKLVLALEQISNFEVDGALLRNELLCFIQNDFKVKDTLFQSDRKKFLNAVLLLGGVFNRIKICGEPIEILGIALLEYFDVLIKGEEEEFKTVTEQIIINGQKLRKINRFEILEHDLRKIIINENLSPKCKCWILLAIDLISNGWKPLEGIVKNFYVANLGEEFKKLELLIPSDKSSQLTSPKYRCSKDVTYEKRDTTESSPSKSENIRKNLSKNFSHLNMKPDKGSTEKVQSPPGKSNKKDYWKPSGGVRKTGHDDRFDREENFYGIQKPRQPKPENQRKNFQEAKITKKESDISKTDFDQVRECQPKSGSESGNS